MRKKIIPALFELKKKHKLPPLFKIIGVGRRDFNEESFSEYVREILVEYATRQEASVSEGVLIEQFLRYVTYFKGDFTKKQMYQELAEALGQVDGTWNVCANKLFYLAVPPEYYETIATNLHGQGLADACGPDEGWTRILLEKPFGKDAKSAEKLDLLLAKLFREEQIYRIDHYLAKEMLLNILTFRFNNNLLENSWNNRHIERIEISTLESLGVEGRGIFYDGVGALRDVGQNHLLQMLALVTMEQPKAFTTQQYHANRLEVFKHLKVLSKHEVKEKTVRAQYEGYRHVEGVNPHSQTETYFKVEAELTLPRWVGVPIILEAGKKFKEAKKCIRVVFRKSLGDYPNEIVFHLEPKEGISITFYSKKPGLTLEGEEREMSFTYRPAKARSQYVEEYVKLLLDCIEGNQLLFLNTREIQSMWKFTDPILNVWQENAVPLLTYPAYAEHPPLPLLSTLKKEIAIIGLGKMGGNMALRLMEKGWRVIGYNRSPDDTKVLMEKGMEGAFSFQELNDLYTSSPRIFWLMLPAGAAVDDTIHALLPFLKKGDMVVDAGNSFYKDTLRRAKALKKAGIHFIDVGFSGGPGGARNGACLMVGTNGEPQALLEAVVKDVAMGGGYQFLSGVGSGHFVKMVHNGIEYGMMQAIAEGFEVMKNGPFHLSLADVARIYNNGSVIESRLIGWLLDGYLAYGEELNKISSTVAHTGEGAWTVETAKELGIRVPVIEESLNFRKLSKDNPRYAGRVLTLLRAMFGGHSKE